MVNFPTQVHDRGSAFLDLLLFSDPSICFTVTFPLLGNSDHVFVVVSIVLTYLQRKIGEAPFHRTAYGYSRGDWDRLIDHLRDVM